MQKRKWVILLILIGLVLMYCSSEAYAAPGISISDSGVTLASTDDPVEIANSVKLLVILTILSLLPSILIMMTSFTRIIVVLSFLRNAMGTQQAPPNQVMVGLALFLTMFIMMPVFTEVNTVALQPFTDGTVGIEEALNKGSDVMKEFMISQTYDKDLALFAGMAKLEEPDNLTDLPITVVTPAFMISELKKAFEMGFMLYIPFLVIDMVVASTLMGMGMMMLPPVMISLPFKILLFLLIDGWNLLADVLVRSFAR